MILFYLREQKFLEALEATQWRQALHILRTQITPLNCLTHRVHALSNLIMMSDVGSMKRKIGWDGGKGISRANVLQKIQGTLRLSPCSLSFAPLMRKDRAHSRVGDATGTSALYAA